MIFSVGPLLLLSLFFGMRIVPPFRDPVGRGDEVIAVAPNLYILWCWDVRDA